MRHLTTWSLLGGGALLALLAVGALLLGITGRPTGPAVSLAAAKCPAVTPVTAPMIGSPQASPQTEASPPPSGTVITAGTPVGTMPAAPEVVTPTATGCEVTIDQVDIKFVPNDVTIPANTPVRFILHNVGKLPHTFTIDKLGVNIDTMPGQTKEQTITAPAGDYQFFCATPGHRAAGMVGTLHVR